MANTAMTYVGTGSQTVFTIPFPYIDKSHVKVYLNEQEVLTPTAWTWLTDQSIKFRVAPALDDSIRVQRWTPGDTRLVDFQNGAVLTADDLDLSATQNFYLAQEAYENYAALLNDAFARVATSQGVVETDPDQMINALVTAMLQDANAANLQQRVQDIDDNAEAIISLGTNLQVQINTLAQGIAALVFLQPTAPVPGVGGVPDPIPDGSRWYDSDDNNKPYMYDFALGGWISIEDPRIGNADVYINALQTQYGAAASAFINEVTSISNEAGASTSALNLLGSENVGGTAFVLDLDTTFVGAAESLSTRFSTISSDIGNNSAAITSEATTRATETGALASDIALMGARNGAQTAFILDTNTVKIDSDVGDTFATRLSNLTAADNANSASITTINTVTIPGINSDITALEAKYGVTLDVNNYITGFSQNNDGSTGSFVILADKFGIVEPGTLTQKIWWDGVNSVLQIDGDVLVSGSVTSTELTGSVLSDLYVSMGNITAGTITLNASGHIKGGATAFETGKGYWLGYDSPNHKFYIGDKTAGGGYLSWDGSTLKVAGDLVAGEYKWNNATTQHAYAGIARTESVYANGFVTKKSFTVDRAGSVKITYRDQVQYNNGSFVSTVQYPQVQLSVNGVAATSKTITNTSVASDEMYVTGLEINDIVTVELRAGQYNNGSGTVDSTAYIDQVALKGEIVFPSNVTVNQD